MLILTRKSGESIQVGDKIKITILEVKGRQVRIGIQAPSNTVIHREEVYLRIKRENIRASSVGVRDLDEGEARFGIHKGSS